MIKHKHNEGLFSESGVAFIGGEEDGRRWSGHWDSWQGIGRSLHGKLEVVKSSHT